MRFAKRMLNLPFGQIGTVVDEPKLSDQRPRTAERL